MASVPWRVEFSKIFKKIIFKIPKTTKIVPKSIQTCFELVLGQIFRKNFLPSVPWRVEFSKIFKKKNIFKIPKRPKIIPKSIQTCFEHVLGRIFRKTFFCPVFHGDFENFQKKIFQNSINAQKCSQKYPNVF